MRMVEQKISACNVLYLIALVKVNFITVIKKINYIKVNNINSNKKTKLIITLISKTCFIIMNFGAVVIT